MILAPDINIHTYLQFFENTTRRYSVNSIEQQETQLLQRGRATLCVVEILLSLTVIQGYSKLHR